MMIYVNLMGTKEDAYISGSYNGISYGVSYDEVKYTEMKRLEALANNANSVEELKTIIAEFEPLTKESYKDLVETKSDWVHVNKHTNKFYLRLPNGKISKKALPKSFVDRILESVDKKIDIMPLVKFWIRVLRSKLYSDAKAANTAWYINQTYTNPALVAKFENDGLHSEVARARATTFQTPITQEGLLCTYKVVDEVDWKWVLDENGEKKRVDRYAKSIDEDSGLITLDKPKYGEDFLFQPAVQHDGYDAFYSGDKEGHLIRVGKTHWLDSWDKVDTNDHHSCVPGLHLGNQDYIRNYQTPGTVTLNCFVDPMDIGAVVKDNTGALRVRRFFAHSIFQGTNRSIYHSSDYAKLTDDEYRKMLEEAIASTGELKATADDELEEKQALID